MSKTLLEKARAALPSRRGPRRHTFTRAEIEVAHAYVKGELTTSQVMVVVNCPANISQWADGVVAGAIASGKYKLVQVGE